MVLMRGSSVFTLTFVDPEEPACGLATDGCAGGLLAGDVEAEDCAGGGGGATEDDGDGGGGGDDGGG